MVHCGAISIASDFYSKTTQLYQQKTGNMSRLTVTVHCSKADLGWLVENTIFNQFELNMAAWVNLLKRSLGIKTGKNKNSRTTSKLKTCYCIWPYWVISTNLQLPLYHSMKLQSLSLRQHFHLVKTILISRQGLDQSTRRPYLTQIC